MPHKFPSRILAQTRTPLLTTGPDVVFVTVEDPQSPVLPSTVNNSGGLLLPQVDRNRPRSKGIALTDTTLRGLKVESKPYKVTNGADLYVVVFHLPAPRLSAITTALASVCAGAWLRPSSTGRPDRQARGHRRGRRRWQLHHQAPIQTYGPD